MSKTDVQSLKASARSLSSDDRLQLLCREVSRIADLEVSPDDSLADITADSLSFVEILMVCEQLYQVQIDMDLRELQELMTLRALVARITGVSA